MLDESARACTVTRGTALIEKATGRTVQLSPSLKLRAKFVLKVFESHQLLSNLSIQHETFAILKIGRIVRACSSISFDQINRLKMPSSSR